MSAEQQTVPSPCCVRAPGDVEAPSGPQSELDTLRTLVNERLTAAEDDILGVIVKTVARYKEQIDRQRRQRDSLRSEEEPEVRWSQTADLLQSSSWMKTCPDEQTLGVQLDHTNSTDVCASAAHVKTEAAGGDCGAAEPNCGFDPAGRSEGASDDRPLAGGSETEDHGDYWREAAGLWKPEETEEEEGQSSLPGTQTKSSADLSHQPREAFQRISYLLTHASHIWETVRETPGASREPEAPPPGPQRSVTSLRRLRSELHAAWEPQDAHEDPPGERPYGCTVCGKSFGRRATLVRHVRSHTGEKPFTCTNCGRGFVEKGNLTVHLRTHTGERPSWCSSCNRRFSQLSCFHKHLCQRRGLTAG
uniref:zinc finger protein 48-like n=1 Tax=Scatophagus argus TaxID=75038 RepID=UPI001ED84996|nr:zinc finger protein 48-like [Scatophagus argus]